MNRLEEKEAYILLQCLWPGWTQDFRNLESPDLQDCTAGVGIEVTQAVPLMRNRYSELGKKMAPGSPPVSRTVLEHTVFSDKDGLLEDPSEEEALLRNASKLIGTKSQKFRTVYRRFRKNGLFLFVRTGDISDAEAAELYRSFRKANPSGQGQKSNERLSLLFVSSRDSFRYADTDSDILMHSVPIDEDMQNILYNVL